MTDNKKGAKQIPTVEGWFTWPPSEEPHLIGSKCMSCGDYFFTKTIRCRNPYCMKDAAVKDLPFSRRAKLWSFTTNYFKPPIPFKSADPFKPFGVAIVEFTEERIKIQGIVASGYDTERLRIGQEMEVVLEKLHDDINGNEVITWKFKPVTIG